MLQNVRRVTGGMSGWYGTRRRRKIYSFKRSQPVRLFSNRSQKTSKCGKNISDTLGYALCATYLFLPHFDVICDLLLNRRTATWNLFVKEKHSCKFGRTRKSCGNTSLQLEFRQRFSFSQTSTRASITR